MLPKVLKEQGGGHGFKNRARCFACCPRIGGKFLRPERKHSVVVHDVAAMPKTKKPRDWRAKLARPAKPEITVTEKDFAGIKAGTRLLISTPTDIAAFVARLRPGETTTVATMRDELAKSAKVEATCPLTTGIFLRIVAEAAWDDLQAGRKPAQVTPFWRVVDPKGPLARKLRCGPGWIEAARARETRG